jgi:predicted nucleic acid-binding protein
LILPDTSVWIDLLSFHPRQLPAQDQLVRFVTCGPIIQEVVQGLRPHPSTDALREAFLALPRISDPLGIHTFLHGAEIYQLGRAKGFTIRSPVGVPAQPKAIPPARFRYSTNVFRSKSSFAVDLGM